MMFNSNIKENNEQQNPNIYVYNNENYLKHLWFVMHHSKAKNKKALVLTCYLDESGTDRNNDINNMTAVVGGIVLEEEGFFAFERKWQKLLRDHKIDPPLHMKEFGQHGRFGHFSVEERRTIFTKVADIVNRYKIISIAASLTKKEFDAHINKKIADHMGIYGFCFQLLAQVWKHYADEKNQKDKIAYVLDNGNEHRRQIEVSRDVIVRKQKEGTIDLYLGSLTFADDKTVSSLQAADVVSWGVRRIWNDQFLNKGFEQILRIYEKGHFEMKWDDDMLKGASDYIVPFISE